MGKTFSSYTNLLTMKNCTTSANQTVEDLHSAFPRSNLINWYRWRCVGGKRETPHKSKKCFYRSSLQLSFIDKKRLKKILLDVKKNDNDFMVAHNLQKFHVDC